VIFSYGISNSENNVQLINKIKPVTYKSPVTARTFKVRLLIFTDVSIAKA
jgi:hypothetical protein